MPCSRSWQGESSTVSQCRYIAFEGGSIMIMNSRFLCQPGISCNGGLILVAVEVNREVTYWYHFPLARGSPRSEDSKKPLTNTNKYLKSRKRSQEPSVRWPYSIKIIQKNVICNRKGNRTIRIAEATNRRSSGFSSSSKTILRNSYKLSSKHKVSPEVEA